MMLLIPLTLLQLLMLSTAALADETRDSEQTVQPASVAVNIQHDSFYEIQPKSSTIKFRADSPVGDVWAKFEAFNGHFTISGKGTGKEPAIVHIDAGSLTTNAGFIESVLKSKIFFDVDTFPSMKFVGTSLDWYNKRNAVLKGDLTIHDVTRQVAFYVQLVDDNSDSPDRITVNVSTTIKRSEFNISSLLPTVSDDVNLFMSIDAIRKPAELTLK